ncbi:hypothetical protein V492_04686 [Pseudogymnoascus sp. VKM F-4246]|nr:hypothetical protein V492_04686 [Pseudogymnoascus sp. VKM F-4246]
MSTTTFHAFRLLPLELRINIWGFVKEDRVLKIRKASSQDHVCWSPTPAPAVTRVCRESREYCSHRRAFVNDSSPRYIWANFDYDIIQMRIALLSKMYPLENDEVKHVRIELMNKWGFKQMLDPSGASDLCTLMSFTRDSRLCDFPKLENLDVLTIGEVSPMSINLIKGVCGYWGVPFDDVLVVDMKWEEWAGETSGNHQEYLDEMEVWRGHEEVREKGVKLLQIPLPPINLDSDDNIH